MLFARNCQVPVRVITHIEGQLSEGEIRVKFLMPGEQISVLEVRMQGGSKSAVHRHEHESVIYVLSGKLRSQVDTELFVLGPGDVCRHPRAVSHWVEALEDTVFVEIKSSPPDMALTLTSAPTNS